MPPEKLGTLNGYPVTFGGDGNAGAEKDGLGRDGTSADTSSVASTGSVDVVLDSETSADSAVLDTGFAPIADLEDEETSSAITGTIGLAGGGIIFMEDS